MKIGFVIGSLDKKGGAERVVVTLSNYWSKKNKDITIYTLSHTELGNDDKYEKKSIFQDNKVKVSRCFQQNTAFFNKFSPFYVLYSKLKQDKPDVIISFIKYPNIISSLLGKVLNIPVIISERTDPERDTFGKELFLKRNTYKLASAIVLQTESVRKSFRTLKIKLPKTQTIIANPLSPDFLVRDDVISIPRENIVIAVGRLSKEKGYINLIKAFALAETENWVLHIIGRDEGTKNALEKLIQHLNVESSVKLLGEKSNIKEHYERAKILVLSSVYEGFPNVLCEAMAMGCACISVDCDYGPSEIIENGKNGLLVTSNDVEEMSRSIELLIKNNKKRQELANEAVAIRKKLNVDSISREWDYLMETLNVKS